MSETRVNIPDSDVPPLASHNQQTKQSLTVHEKREINSRVDNATLSVEARRHQRAIADRLKEWHARLDRLKAYQAQKEAGIEHRHTGDPDIWLNERGELIVAQTVGENGDTLLLTFEPHKRLARDGEDDYSGVLTAKSEGSDPYEVGVLFYAGGESTRHIFGEDFHSTEFGSVALEVHASVIDAEQGFDAADVQGIASDLISDIGTGYIR